MFCTHAYGNYCQIKLFKNNFLTNPDIRTLIQFFQILKRNSGLPGGFVGVVAIRVFAGGAAGVLVAVLTWRKLIPVTWASINYTSKILVAWKTCYISRILLIHYLNGGWYHTPPCRQEFITMRSHRQRCMAMSFWCNFYACYNILQTVEGQHAKCAFI